MKYFVSIATILVLIFVIFWTLQKVNAKQPYKPIYLNDKFKGLYIDENKYFSEIEDSTWIDTNGCKNVRFK